MRRGRVWCRGLVSRSGVALLRELTEVTGLVEGWSEQLLDTYKAFPTVHAPGRVRSRA